MMRSEVIVQPTLEPLTRAEARLHLRNPEITADAEILWFIKAARETVENKLQRSLLTQTRRAYLEEFPCANSYGVYDPRIEIPYPPLQRVTSITYKDSAAATQTIPAENYVVDTSGAWVKPAYGKAWPSGYSPTIECVTGWTHPNEVPESIKQWIRLAIAAFDNNRSLTQERELSLTPFAEGLLDRFRVHPV